MIEAELRHLLPAERDRSCGCRNRHPGRDAIRLWRRRCVHQGNIPGGFRRRACRVPGRAEDRTGRRILAANLQRRHGVQRRRFQRGAR